MGFTGNPYPPRKCSLLGCGRGHVARGYCSKHYRQYVTRGGRVAQPQEFGPNYYAVKALLEAGKRPVEIARQLGISRQRASQLAKKKERVKNPYKGPGLQI